MTVFLDLLRLVRQQFSFQEIGNSKMVCLTCSHVASPHDVVTLHVAQKLNKCIAHLT